MWQELWQWFLAPENQKICVGIVAAFITGLVVGRLVRHKRVNKIESAAKEGDKAFFKGIQYILSNDHDHAIEEFSKSVQVNSETVETYVALANLYRSKGDIDRAIRIRQNIILRPSISEQIRIRALIDLGLDYRKGGFLNRALKTFLEVLKREPSHTEVLEETEKIFEEMKDWANAFEMRRKITRLDKGNHKHILAHHQTELGKAYQENGDLSKARSCFNKAISIDEGCVDAYLHLGDLYFGRQEYKKAIGTWKRVVEVAPRYTFLAYRRLEGAYARMENLQPVEDFLKECARLRPDPFTRLALARYLYNEQDYEGALKELEGALAVDPSFLEARKFMGEILLHEERREDALVAYRDLISHLNVAYLKFQCSYCGFKPDDLHWQCPKCKKWDTINFIDSQLGASAPSQQLPAPIFDLSEERPEEV